MSRIFMRGCIAFNWSFHSFYDGEPCCSITGMLTNTLYRAACEKGLKLLQKRGEGGAGELTSWRLYLENGERQRYFSDSEETILVLQQGAGTLSAAGSDWRVSRSQGFTKLAK